MVSLTQACPAPHGTRITLIHDSASVMAIIGFPDGSGDTLKLP